MRALDVVVPEPGTQRERTAPGAGIRHDAGPTANERFDESFSFPVGLGAVRACAREADAIAIRRRAKPMTAIAAAVVREYASNGGAAPGEPPHGTSQEAGDGAARLVGQDFDASRPTVVIDGHVHVLHPAPTLLRRWGTMRWPPRRMRPSGLISRWTNSPGRVRSSRCTGAGGVRWANRFIPTRTSTAAQAVRCSWRAATTAATTVGEVRRGWRCGREEASSSAGRPPKRCLCSRCAGLFIPRILHASREPRARRRWGSFG